ncbi:bifunctional DNA primase/polymerase [Streptomyces sp. Da 82-17]|uniref:bifunctional DNA primase/polymerase n=1 Tax=Streptomyces sp. Da 82-17 TaxID=3377116 RepID=UPI0038D39260
MEETIEVAEVAEVAEAAEVARAAQVPQQRGEQLPDTAVRYAKERHWDVFPGTWLEAEGGFERCSCGDASCEVPGAHPVREDWRNQATGSATVARRLWSKQPAASILLPTGRTFDALDVPESAGFLALARMERMDLTLGPVTLTPGRRMQFFVLPGAAPKTSDLVRKLGWPPASLDLRALGEGDWVAAPPTRVGGRGAVQWVRRPTPANRWLPDAEELISSLAYACGRERRA